MKTIIATERQGKIVGEVTGGRKEAMEFLLSRRMVGSFLLLCTDRLPKERVDMEWLLISKVNSREVSVSYAPFPAGFNWEYLTHFSFPRTVSETVADAIRALGRTDPEPPEAPQIHRQAITDSMDLIGPGPGPKPKPRV
jgi:hypothetical protein